MTRGNYKFSAFWQLFNHAANYFAQCLIPINLFTVYSESLQTSPLSQVSNLTDKDGRSSLSSFRIKMQPTIDETYKDRTDAN